MTPDKILNDAAELYKEKHKEYGNNWKRVGPILCILLGKSPKIFSARYWDCIHLITMIVVKLTRFVFSLEKGEFHKDSTRDLVVYTAMLDSLGEK